MEIRLGAVVKWTCSWHATCSRASAAGSSRLAPLSRAKPKWMGTAGWVAMEQKSVVKHTLEHGPQSANNLDSHYGSLIDPDG